MQQRMYFFVPYNISEIQKAIQAGHAALEYAERYGQTDEYRDFIRLYKTWIILNGGTTRSIRTCVAGEPIGTLNSIVSSLEEAQIKFSTFYEPDLNYSLTAICFLADERVWDTVGYPDYDYEREYEHIYLNRLGGKENVFLRELIRDKRLA